jgi:response regulator RpfG family c-di-GMP phosphodiesterase
MTEQATILIVDDQPENLAVLSTLLQPHYSVRAARSGELALRVAATPPQPDLVLLDVMMPGMDGYHVIAKLRENPATRGLPVIFITALAAEDDEERGFQAGAVDYITKPIKPATVLARVHTHLELKTARDALSNENARLEATVAERTATLKQTLQKMEVLHGNLKKSYFSTLMAISQIIEIRGGGIGEHSRRVAELARLVASKMGLEADEAQQIFIAALLHDAGRIGFSDDLLRKSVSAMTREELDIYRHHPARGADAIKQLDTMSDIADIVRHHHENYDGSGFPDGLSGLNIPLGSRIIGAASDYYALKNGQLTERPMSGKESLTYLMGTQGSRYDPIVLDKLALIVASLDRFEIDEVPIKTAHIHEGMVLTRDIHQPSGFTLLSKGTVLTLRLKEQLVAVEQQSGAALKIYVQRETKP